MRCIFNPVTPLNCSVYTTLPIHARDLITLPDVILSNAVATMITIDVGIPLLAHGQTTYTVLLYWNWFAQPLSMNFASIRLPNCKNNSHAPIYLYHERAFAIFSIIRFFLAATLWAIFSTPRSGNSKIWTLQMFESWWFAPWRVHSALYVQLPQAY